MINADLTYAVIGASANTDKYGHKVFRDLLENEYNVIPINPKGGELLGKTVYPTLAEFPEKIDVAIFVVPPHITMKLLDDAKAKGVKTVWMQPGSESPQAIARCHDLGFECISKACIMVQRQSSKHHETLGH